MKFTGCYKVLERTMKAFVESRAKDIDASCTVLLTAAARIIASAQYLEEHGEQELEKGNNISFYCCGLFRTELGAKRADLWAQLAVLKKASEPDASTSTFAAQSKVAKAFLYECVLPFFNAIAASEKSLLEEKFDFQQGEQTFMEKQRRNAGNRAKFLAEQQAAVRAKAETASTAASDEFDGGAEAGAAAAAAPARVTL